jgi:hypothetical protein
VYGSYEIYLGSRAVSRLLAARQLCDAKEMYFCQQPLHDFSR